MIKISILKKGIMILNVYAPNKIQNTRSKIWQIWKKSKLTHNYSWKLQHTTLSKQQQTENQQGYREAEQHNRPTKSNWYLSNISSYISRIDILFKCAWNMQNNTVSQVTNTILRKLKNRNYKKYFLNKKIIEQSNKKIFKYLEIFWIEQK